MPVLSGFSAVDALPEEARGRELHLHPEPAALGLERARNV